MDKEVKRMIFGLCLFVVIWNWQIGEVNSSACHYFSKKELDWFDALFFCQGLNMCLPDMSTRTTFEEIENKLQDRAEYWFGLTTYEKLDFRYVSSHKPKEYVPPQSEMSSTEACAFLKPLEKDAYVIGTATCGARKRFVCAPSKMCNGLKLNGTSGSDFPPETPCSMSADVTKILGI